MVLWESLPFSGISTVSHRAIVQMAGSAFRMRSRHLQTEFHGNKMVQSALLRCVQDLLTQISQTVVCNRLHQVEKRLCRWLLLSHDRAQSDQLVMTQEFISHLLGSRRESVTVAAARLQDAGLIHYARGKIAILDRAGLESAACECYQAVREEMEPSSPKKPCQPVTEADNRRLSSRRADRSCPSELRRCFRRALAVLRSRVKRYKTSPQGQFVPIPHLTGRGIQPPLSHQPAD